MIISGEELKNKYKNTSFYILLNEKEKYNNFQFTNGVNEVVKKFNIKTGFWFSSLENMPYFLNNKIKYIREVKIVNESYIVELENKIITDIFVLRKKIKIEDFKKWKDKDFCFDAIKKNLFSTTYTLLTEDFYKNIILLNYDIFRYIKKELQTFNLCYLSICKNGKNFRCVREDLQTYDLCELALCKKGKNFRYIRKDLQTYELCELGIVSGGRGRNLGYVREDLIDNNLCRLAVGINGYALKFIKEIDRTYHLINLANNNYSIDLKNVKEYLQTYELCELAISSRGNWDNLKFVKKDLLDINLYKLAVGVNGESLKFIKDQTYLLCKLAIRNYKNALQYVRRDLIDYNLCKFAIYNKCSLEYVDKELQTYDLCKMAIENNGFNLRFVREDLIDYNLCKFAIYNKCSLEYVDKELQTYDLCKMAIENNKFDIRFVREDLIDELCKYKKY